MESQYNRLKDSYTYRQILIGLRNEFLEYQKKLNKLRELSVVFGKDDYNYNLYKPPYSKELPELVVDKCIKEYNPKTVGALISLIYHSFFYHKPTRTIMVRDNNGNYFPKRINGNNEVKKNEFAIFPRYEDNAEFIELANEILGSDFANMMQLDSKIAAVPSVPIVYKKTPTIVPTVSSFGFVLCTDKSRFEYLGRNDVLKFSSVKRPNEKWQPLTEEHLDFISKIEFPKDAFSEYHQGLIEKSVDDNRPFVLSEDYQPELFTRFEIQDSPKQLVLAKSQRKIKL